MIEAYSIEQVRQAEADGMADLPEGELMQRAARGLAEVVAARLVALAEVDGGDPRSAGDEEADPAAAGRVVVLAGPGDNGGDALFAAADLAARGVAVAAIGIGADTEGAPWTAAAASGAVLITVEPSADRLTGTASAALAEAVLVVDGLLGIGARPGLRSAMAAAVAAIHEDAYVIAVDLPSGADPQGYEPVRGDAVFADETVTFGAPKPVHLLPGTEPAVGRLSIVDIGIDEQFAGRPVAVARLGHDDIAELWPVPGAGDDKYSRGVLGVVAGSARYPGAAVLTTTAALETGVGMVRYLGPRRAEDLVLAAGPEVVPGPGRVQAWLLGSGVDPEEVDPAQKRAITDALASDLPCVVDAGALDFVDGPRRGPTLLTPHAGEMARMLNRLGDGCPVTREEVVANPLAHLNSLVELTDAAVLLKGSTTLVGASDGPVFSQTDGPVWLATAGSGDVLAGLAGALLASGLDAVTAGAAAALVHGLAADHANPGGPIRAVAVAHAIPGAVRHLLHR